MDKLLPQLNLYEHFSMLIPGTLLMNLFLQWAEACNITLPKVISSKIFPDQYHWIFFLIFAYLLGVFWHRLMECIFSFDRNIPNRIRKARQAVQEESKAKCVLGNILNENSDDSDIIHQYYIEYYALAEADRLGSIPLLEARVAFLNNMLVILLLYCLYIVITSIGVSCWCFLLSVVVSLVTIPCVYLLKFSIQDKIYRMVIESYYFYIHKRRFYIVANPLSDEKDKEGFCTWFKGCWIDIRDRLCSPNKDSGGKSTGPSNTQGCLCSKMKDCICKRLCPPKSAAPSEESN